MADEKAAFGVFPQMKPRRSKQDREAAKNVPIDLARGFVAGALGMPGDIESLARLPYELITGKESPTILPTSEDIEKRLPFKSDTPVSRAATGLGQIGGGFYTGPGSPLKAIAGVPKAIKHGAEEFAKASAMGVPHVVKPKGGNWLTGNVEKQLGRMKMADYTTPEQFAEMQRSIDTAKRIMGDDPTVQRTVAQMENELNTAKRNNAINSWIDRNLTNYVKKEMGTPEDPVRRLAEQDILHIKPIGDQYEVSSRLMNKRKGVGFNPLGEGKSEAARFWERQADISLEPYPAGSYKHGSLDESLLEANPWLKNVPDEEMIHYSKGLNDLGFDHIVDVLRQDVREGRIRPEQLSKVSMEQAVRRTYEYDQEMAKKMREAQIKATEGMPVHKEYPEGFKWVELKAQEPESLPEGVKRVQQSVTQGGLDVPGVGYIPAKWNPEKGLDWEQAERDAKKALSYEPTEKALKYEGETMGHCVGGYCPDVMEGRSRIYSLRDAKGEPHVTVEVKPKPTYTEDDVIQQFPGGVTDAMRAGDVGGRNYIAKKLAEINSSGSDRIVQIKGKQNRAPKEEYLPFVQDFVRGGQWSEVGDLRNTGLRDINKYEPLKKYLEGKGEKFDRYIPEEQFKGYEDDFLMDRLYPKDDLNYTPPTEGMKRGGSVHISDNLDAMMMDVEDRKMAGGGLSKLAKLARAVPKTKQEIEAIAERIAPQVTGEFVREGKGTQSVAGKTQKQFAREKDLPVKFTDIKQGKPVEVINPEKLQGMVVTGIPGDPTITGKSLVSVGDIRLDSPSPQHGGPMYGRYQPEDIFWASGIGPAGGVQRVAKEAMQAYDAPVAGQYIMMGPDSINYAQHFADANLSAIDLSKMSKKQIEEFNKLVRFGDEKSGPRPAFPGIEDKESSYLHLAFDPHLRRHFNRLMQMPTVTERLNLPSGQDIRFAVTEPELRNLETGVTGFSMGRLQPEVPKSALPLSTHPTYSHDIPGQFMGGMKYPTPYELTFPDTLKSVRENPKQAGQEFGSLKMVGPRQIYDQQMIDELKMYEEAMKKLTGKKKGGAVEKPDNGLIKVTKKRKAKA